MTTNPSTLYNSEILRYPLQIVVQFFFLELGATIERNESDFIQYLVNPLSAKDFLKNVGNDVSEGVKLISTCISGMNSQLENLAAVNNTSTNKN